MSDNKLRCVAAYRLKGRSVTCLAKYDHANSADSGALYGAGKDFANAVATVVGKDPPGTASEAKKIGGFKVVNSDMHQVVYGADKAGVCLAVITGQKYPSRIAIQLLTELYDQFATKYAGAIPTASANSLTKKSKGMMSNVCKKYGDLSNVDKTQALMGKVDGVKGQMQDNISNMLKNTEKASDIAEQSEQLNEQANVFKKNSTELKKQMRCKNLKMTIILVSIVVGILLVILVPMFLKAK